MKRLIIRVLLWIAAHGPLTFRDYAVNGYARLMERWGISHDDLTRHGVNKSV